jgi:hypothetical protein
LAAGELIPGVYRIRLRPPTFAQLDGAIAAAVTPAGGLFVLLIVVAGDQTAAVALSIEPDHSS